MVRPGVALCTAIRDCTAGVCMNRRKHLAARGGSHVLQTRTVTALTLNVVITRVFRAAPAGDGDAFVIR